MSALTTLLPREANNDYRGGPVPLYTFCLLSTVMPGRSLIHFLKDDSGVNSIATIVTFAGSPDPNDVIYMFSALWGSQQLIMVMLYGLVLLRYRNLVPLMYVVFIVEVGFRMVVGALHPLSEEFYARTPLGKYANLPLLVISATMLFLSLRRRGVERSELDTNSLPAR
jgi:hypothetical protein